MPITEQHRKEDLGQAYVRAVIAKAGFNYGKDDHDYGIDGTIKEVTNIKGRFFPSGAGICYQLKSSCDVQFQDDVVIYDLESKNYNDLVADTLTFPIILILFVLPKSEDEWLSVTENEINPLLHSVEKSAMISASYGGGADGDEKGDNGTKKYTVG